MSTLTGRIAVKVTLEHRKNSGLAAATATVNSREAKTVATGDSDALFTLKDKAIDAGGTDTIDTSALDSSFGDAQNIDKLVVLQVEADGDNNDQIEVTIADQGGAGKDGKLYLQPGSLELKYIKGGSVAGLGNITITGTAGHKYSLVLGGLVS